MRNGTRNIAAAVLAAACLLLPASPCFPAARNLWPMDFSLASGPVSMAEAQATARQTFDFLSGLGGSATFVAPVSLPVGAAITRLGFHAYSATPTTVRATLRRSKIGNTETVALTERTTSYVPQWVTDPLPAPHVVQAGWRYSVEIYVSSGGAIVHGAKVAYRP